MIIKKKVKGECFKLEPFSFFLSYTKHFKCCNKRNSTFACVLYQQQLSLYIFHDNMPNSTPPSRASIDNNTRFTRSPSGMKLALDPEPNGNTHTPPTITTTRPLARERPFAREDVNTSRPPSIRSATSFGGRPNINRFIPGHHARHHSSYSNFSTMSETALPWTTRDIGFNAISGTVFHCNRHPLFFY